MSEDFDRIVSALVDEQTLRTALQQENDELRRQLEECQGGGEPQPDERGGFGYYQQGTDVSAIYTPQEQRWNREIDRILCFLPDDDWTTIAVPDWWADSFGSGRSRWASDYGTTISMPLCPGNVEDVTKIDPQKMYDAFLQAGAQLVSAGLQRSILRIGWESQGTWYPWSSVDNPGTYKARFRDAVAALRQAHGQDFLIDWNIAGGKQVDLDAFPDPGDVDVVSIDLYDTPGHDLDDFRAWLDQAEGIAADNACSIAVAEWGLWDDDDPAYMDLMTSWITEHRPLYKAYFDVSSSSDHRLSLYPQSAEIYGAWAPGAP